MLASRSASIGSALAFSEFEAATLKFKGVSGALAESKILDIMEVWLDEDPTEEAEEGVGEAGIP